MGIYTTPWSAAVSGTTIKTLAQITAGAATRAEIIQFSVSFNGTSASAVPVLIQLNRQTTAGTASAGVRNPQDTGDGASAASALITYTVEPTAGLVMYADYYTPVGLGPFIQYPLGRGIVVPLSGRIGITITAAVSISCAGHITWVE